MSDSVQPYGQQPTRPLFPWNSPGRNTGCLPPGDLADPGIEPASPESPALAGGFFIPSTTGEAHLTSNK